MEYRNKHSPLCNNQCSGKACLKTHLQKHATQQPFACTVIGCGFKASYETNVELHVTRVHSDDRPYECTSDGCPYKAKCEQHLRNHLKLHSSEGHFVCTVPGCNYTCKFKRDLSNHINRLHSDEKALKCSTCDFRTKARSTLFQHQLTHRKIKRFHCQVPQCDYASHHSRSVKIHFDSHHRKKKLKCTAPRCKYRCGSVNLLKVHLKQHQHPILKCPGAECNFSTKFKNTLLLHISRRHHNLQAVLAARVRKLDLEAAGTTNKMDTLHCGFPNCGYHTEFPHHYDRHQATHNEGEKRKYVCAFCFSRFSHMSQLHLHLQRHTGEKPYSCSYCEFKGCSKSDLKVHSRKVHHIYLLAPCTKNQEEKCRTCGKSFWSYSELVLHSMSHLQPVVVLELLKLKIM